MSQKGSLVRGISAEMQDMILATLIFDEDMYDATKDVISEPFFYGEDYKTLFRALKQFHISNKAKPTLKDMMIQVSLIITNQSDLINAKALLKQLHNDYIEEYGAKEDTVKRSYFEEFVKRNGAEYCFSTIVEDSKTDDGIDWGKVIPKFKKYTDFTIVNSTPYNMGSIDELKDVREDALGGLDCTRKIQWFLPELNNLMNHKALIPGTLTMVSAAPGTGKTLFLVNQAIQATKDGFVSLHIFLGDLNKYDADMRYLANYSQKKLGDILGMTIDEQQQLQKDLNNVGDTKDALSKCWLHPLPSGVYNVQQLCNEILSMQLKYDVHFDQIIIDYDANIKPNSDDMYGNSGEIYNYLREFGIKNKSVMIVASQPKITFYTQEVLTLDAASESSMKQHIIDTMITLGRPGKVSAPISILYIPKNRNGIGNKQIPLFVDGSKQTIKVISREEYDRIKIDCANREE